MSQTSAERVVLSWHRNKTHGRVVISSEESAGIVLSRNRHKCSPKHDTYGRAFVTAGLSAVQECALPTKFSYLFLILFPNLEHFLVGKADPVQSLQTVVFSVPEPIGGGMSGSAESFDFARVRQMRSTAQVNQITALVHGGASVIRHLGPQNLHLERIVGKQLKAFLFGNYKPLEWLLLLDNFVNLGFDGGVCQRT